MNRWSRPPDRLPALEDTIHVWLLELEDAGFDPAVWQNRLSTQERARATRLRFKKDRRRFTLSHAGLRDIIGRYVKTAADTLQFALGPNGKPKLAPPFDAAGVQFNLSHSYERAVIAVNHAHEIGIDIEFARTEFDFLEVARRFFTAREVRALRALPTALQRQAFYKCWTSKEAFLKAKGTGLAGALDEVRIALDNDHVRIEASMPGWCLTTLDLPAGYEVALVTRNKPMKICCYRWQAG